MANNDSANGAERGRSSANSATMPVLDDWTKVFQAASKDELSYGAEDGNVARDVDSFQLDPFAMAHLQSTASAILAAQEHRQHEGFLTSPPINTVPSSSASASAMSGSESEASRSRTVSPNTQRPTKSERSSLSRSHSLGKAQDASNKAAHAHDRHMWTTEETQALVKGCNKHGVGNWKAILSDPELTDLFKTRTPGDLKDRFRTYFPDAYHDLYPNAKTHTSRAVRSKAADGTSIFEKGKTKERRPFSAAEDEVLKEGYEKHGSHWAIIAREPVFEGKRKSTDLRDRFRNAFPGIYEQAGFKPRTKVIRRERRTSGSGSFSQAERPSLPHTSHSEEHQLQRPALDTRRDTSSSNQSQDISEISEDDESAYQSDAMISRGESASSLTASQQSSARASRSHSCSAGTAPLQESRVPQSVTSEQPLSSAATTTVTHATSTAAPRHPLRRSHSSKRGSASICSIEQAMKNANAKSTRGAILATHHHGTHQHHLHPHISAMTSHKIAQALAPGEVRRDEVSAGDIATTQNSEWTVPTDWDKPSDSITSAGDLVAAMDLDQINDLIRAQDLMAGMTPSAIPAEAAPLPQTALPIDGISAAQNALLDNLLQQWSSSSEQVLTGRTPGNDTFQALLDPLAPSYNGMQDQYAPASMWTPISSSLATAVSTSSPATASRRDHEHNQWAGDLLHRGTFDALMFDPHAFISLMNGQAPGAPAATLRDVAMQEDQAQNALDHRPSLGEHSLSMPDFATLGSNGLGVMQSNSSSASDAGVNMRSLPAAYRNPYAYPADDLSLINSNFSGDVGFLPNGNAGPSSDSMGLLMRRRRSTDTLRESSGISAMQPWKNIADGTLFSDVEETSIAQSIAEGSFSAQSGDHSRSLSSIDVNDDDDNDIPSRAASVGNMDFANLARDQSLYAESLPDLTSAGFGDGASASLSSATFGQLPQMQMSYDDMDLPSFLNRSPGFANMSTAGQAPGNNTGSPRLPLASDAWRSFAPRQQLVNRAQSQLGPGNEASVGSHDASGCAANTSSGFHRAMSDIDAVTDTQDFARHFAVSRMNDAGALDRLEHLYLEGLHTPASPLMSNLYASQQQQQQQQQQSLGSGDAQFLPFEQQRWAPSQRAGRASVGFARTDTIRAPEHDAAGRSSS